uniref:28S ribosomal protein S18c, mitochondrial n=2 Tax=Ascaris TaxID=6251 RepID=A0A0M3I8L0_ASCLU
MKLLLVADRNIATKILRSCFSSDGGTLANASACTDTPVELSNNPYEKEKRKCILCAHNIELDYKNARLLQQFVSSFSGRVYDRHVTGLCEHQQKKLVATIALSRRAGYMPILVKDPKYLRDAKLFDPLKPIRSHSFA